MVLINFSFHSLSLSLICLGEELKHGCVGNRKKHVCVSNFLCAREFLLTLFVVTLLDVIFGLNCTTIQHIVNIKSDFFVYLLLQLYIPNQDEGVR